MVVSCLCLLFCCNVIHIDILITFTGNKITSIAFNKLIHPDLLSKINFFCTHFQVHFCEFYSSLKLR